MKESKASSGQQQTSAAPAIRIKVTGAGKNRWTLPTEQPLSSRDVELARQTIEASIAEEASKSPRDICVSVTPIQISKALADRLKKNQELPSWIGKPEGPVAQSLTVEVDKKPVFRTDKPLRYERCNLLEVAKSLSGRPLEDLLSHAFVIHNRLEDDNNGCRSYSKVKTNGNSGNRAKKGSDRRNGRKAETSRFSQPARMALFVGRR